MRTVGFLLVCGAAIGLLAASSAFAASSSIDTITAPAITAPGPFEQASAIGIEETVLGSQLLSTEVNITYGDDIGFILKAEAWYGVDNDNGKTTATKKPIPPSYPVGWAKLASAWPTGGLIGPQLAVLSKKPCIPAPQLDSFGIRHTGNSAKC